MFRLATIFLLLAILRASTPLKELCPPPEYIHPCTCQTVTPKDTENWVTCDNIASLKKLTPAIAALRGYAIRKFRLSKAKIGFIPSNLFFKTTVSEIIITETEISSFTQSEETPFSGLENVLESLSLRNCKLGTNIKWERFYGLHKLTYLDLSFNKLIAMDEKWFRFSHPTLAWFTMKGSNVEGIADDAFSKLLDVKVLDLSENKLKSLKRSMFPTDSTIQILNLSNNKISSLPEDIFHKMPFLKKIHLMFNHLQTFDELVWKPIYGQVSYIDVEGNPIVCDLSVCWITQYELPEFFYGKCLEPSDLKGQNIRSLEFWHIENCTNPKKFLKDQIL